MFLTNYEAEAFDAIKDITATDDRASSDIRFYCDDDAYGQKGDRWQLKPLVGGKKKNKKRPLHQQEWWDEINHIYRSPGSFGCKDDDITTNAQIYKIKDDIGTEGENPDRVAITVR